MKLVVTGGAGFIGTNFVRFVLENRPKAHIVNLDVLTYAGVRANLAEFEGTDRYRFVHGDIVDSALVEDLVSDADAIVNFAAESHVDRSIQDASPFVRTNVDGVRSILDAVRRVGRRDFRVVQVSTDEVYGDLPIDRPDLKFREDTPICPHSPYSASKAAGDLLVQAYHHTFGMDTVTTRCSNNFGPYQFPEKVIPLFVTNLLRGEQVPLYGDGLNVRDWLHVIDHCEAILAVLERGRAGEVYNIGGNNERNNRELTNEILRVLGKGPEFIKRVPDRLGHDQRYAIDASKIERELNWRPTRSAWPAALESTVSWYRANEAWWTSLRDLHRAAAAGAHAKTATCKS
ncbi:MAG: dTDP-glucose 4,6-dehydratase [Phycisphaerae bacterium]|nr:dTDP-glucose 4,6-dehydratase [Phycisphaerae bacterium]